MEKTISLIINYYFKDDIKIIKKFLPSVSFIGILLIVAIVISNNSEKILTSGLIILVSVMLLNLLGYLFAKTFKLSPKKRRTIAIETGMQNSGLASSLAGSTFPTLLAATVPGAIFSVWPNISGFILSFIFKKIDERNEKNNPNPI